MNITPDFSEAVELSGTIPDGVYTVRITDAEMRESKAGNKYINWTLQIYGAPGDFAKYNNWTVFHRTMVSGRGAGMLRDFVKAATGEVPTGSFDTDTLLGHEVQVTLKTGKTPEGEDSRYPDVKAIKSVQ